MLKRLFVGTALPRVAEPGVQGDFLARVGAIDQRERLQIASALDGIAVGAKPSAVEPADGLRRHQVGFAKVRLKDTGTAHSVWPFQVSIGWLQRTLTQSEPDDAVTRTLSVVRGASGRLARLMTSTWTRLR